MSKQKIALLMLNLGGPISKQDISPYLTRFFSDDTVIQIPFKLGKYIGMIRGPLKLEKQYEQIGGYSPLNTWNTKQAQLLENELSKSSQHKYDISVGHRYGHILYNDAIDLITKQGQNYDRIILFSQFPQYSCFTGGNILRFSLDYIESQYPQLLNKVTLIDRWYFNEKYIKSIARLLKEDIETNLTKQEQKDMIIIFSSHSLPLNALQQGDQYPLEIASSADMVMKELNYQYTYSWQSKVGFQQWIGPSTIKVMESYQKKFKNVVLVPLGFTSDHLETLYEIDIELKHQFKDQYNKIIRCRSLNDEPDFIQALSDVVMNHVNNGAYRSPNLQMRCPGCKFQMCNKLKQEVLI